MKSFFIFPFILAICWACTSPAGQISSAKQDQSPTPIPAAENLNNSTESYLREDEDIVNRSGEIQVVFMGYLTLKDGRITSEKDWDLGEDKDEDTLKKGMIFDVMTCAGFVTKAKLKKWHGKSDASDEGYDWEMELVTDKSSKSIENLMRKCQEPEAKQVRAFAIYPSKSGREKVQIQNTPDLMKIFDSISSRDKKWIASDDPENTGYSQEKEKVPDIEAWTDSDGDGQIDLIEIKGNCNGQPDGDLICMQVLHFSNNKWLRVGWLATD